MDGMDMSTTTMAMGATSTAAMESMSTSTSSMDMGSTSMGSTMMMSVFQVDMDTPLYTTMWTPNSVGAYAATCIFIILLAVAFRGLLAAKGWQERRWLAAELQRRYVVVNGKGPLADNLSRDSLGKNMVLSENGLEENVMVVQKRPGHSRPWRLSVDPIRAFLDMIIAGVGYLLMLAVMTMNVGYFLSVLGGTFLGSLLVGRFVTNAEH